MLLSNRVCKDCHHKLATFYYFKQELVSKQERLYELLEERKATEEIEELHEYTSIGFEEKPARLDPEMNIKLENGVEIYRIPEVFESIDYDVSSGEFLLLRDCFVIINTKIFLGAQLDFGRCESPETLAYSPSQKKQRKRKDPFRDAEDIIPATSEM